MESTNNNLHHHLQDPLELQSSSSSSYAVAVAATSTTNSWSTPIYISLNAAAGNLNHEANHPRSRSLITHNNDSMIQDLGYHQQQWRSDAAAESCLNSINNHPQLDSSSSSSQFSVAFPKFTEMLNSSTVLPSTFTGNLYSTNDHNYPNFGSTNIPSRENFSQIYPTINISNLNHNQNQNQNQLSLNLDLLNSPGLSHHSQNHVSHNNLSFSLHNMQHHHPTDSSSCNNSTNTSLFSNGSSGAETKRPCTLIESKTPQSQTALKKSRSSESRPSCPPFKVRKEKLGDRIAALQQMVAPFGKTDTASVLMEAIGYIKFLQGQVETLSVPYMKPSQKDTNRVMQGVPVAEGEAKQDLRSRGLCLVPLSCMSYIAGDGGSEVWQQRPNFGRPT